MIIKDSLVDNLHLNTVESSYFICKPLGDQQKWFEISRVKFQCHKSPPGNLANFEIMGEFEIIRDLRERGSTVCTSQLGSLVVGQQLR